MVAGMRHNNSSEIEERAVIRNVGINQPERGERDLQIKKMKLRGVTSFFPLISLATRHGGER